MSPKTAPGSQPGAEKAPRSRRRVAVYQAGDPDASAKNIEHIYRLKPQKVCSIIRRKNGLMTDVAKHFGVPYTTMLRYAKQRPEVNEALVTAREAMGDVAEGKLFQLIREGDVRCLLYYLSTVHAKRGYGLRAGSDPFDPEGVKRPMHVETINIIGVPSGTFLPKKEPVVIDQ